MKPTVLALLLFAAAAQAADPFLYNFVFKGLAYSRDSDGNIVSETITERTLLEDRAAMGGVNPNTLAIVFHLNGDEKGDTVEIVNSNGVKQAFVFAFFFGSDASLGRTALTNAARTEIRRVDQVFTLENSNYSSQNGHGVGSVFLTKRFVRDTNGVLHATFEGPIEWMVQHSPNGPKMCWGQFVASQPFR